MFLPGSTPIRVGRAALFAIVGWVAYFMLGFVMMMLAHESVLESN